MVYSNNYWFRNDHITVILAIFFQYHALISGYGTLKSGYVSLKTILYASKLQVNFLYFLLLSILKLFPTFYNIIIFLAQKGHFLREKKGNFKAPCHLMYVFNPTTNRVDSLQNYWNYSYMYMSMHCIHFLYFISLSRV